MNDIIKNIEAEQLKENAPEINVGDTVKVYATWPVHSPHVERVEIVRRGKVRRAKLNYLRGRVGKRAKVKELVK